MSPKLIFKGSHHYASELAKATDSKVQTGNRRRTYMVSTTQDVKPILEALGFSLTETSTDEECIEQTFTKKQPEHCVPVARQQTVFHIRFFDDPNSGSAYFSQREL